MICYVDEDARRIQAKVGAKLGWKPEMLDLFCKVTPKVGEPYFMPNRHTLEVDEAVKELGIDGRVLVLPEPQVRRRGFSGPRPRP